MNVTLQGDPELLEKVEGLSPDKEKHQFLVEFYQVLFTGIYFELSNKIESSMNFLSIQYAGAPLNAEVRAQVNFEIVPIEQIPFMKDLQPMYLPLLWFEDCVNLDKKLAILLKFSLIL